jgi:uncharacterized protein YndB with AHSA1/START domain
MNDLVRNLDPKLDLMLDRIIDVPVNLVWRAWTAPEHLMKWFTPQPWKTVECEIDLRPGGIFRTVIESPDGDRMDTPACYLEVVENEKLAFTDAMQRDFRPSSVPNACFDHYFTAHLFLRPEGNGTRYTVIALHASEADRKAHEEQGFHDGWGTALDQLVAMVKSMV